MITRFFNWLNSLFVNRYAASLVRGLLKSVSGFLLAIGIAPEQAEQFVNVSEPILLAVIFFAVGQLMSFAEQKKK